MTEAAAPHDVSSRALRLRIGLLVLLTANGLSSLVGTALTPVLSTVAEHFGGGSSGALTAQNIVTVSAIGIMIGGPLAGLLARWVSVRVTLILSLAVYAAFGSAGMYLESAPALLAARLVQGMGNAGISITTAAMIADCFEGPARARFLGYRDAFLAAFGFFALIGSGMLADAAGWRANFGLYLLALPMMGLVLWGQFPQPTVPRADAPPPDVKVTALSLWPIYLMVVALYLLAYTLYLNLSFLLAGDGIASSTLQGRILATSTVLHFFGSMFYGRLVERVGSRWIIVLTLLCMALSDIVIGLAPNTLWIVVGTGLAGLAGGNLQIYLTNLVLSRAPAPIRSQCLGYMYSAMYVGQFLDPFVATPLRQAVGNHEAFLVIGGVLFTAAVVLIILRRLKP